MNKAVSDINNATSVNNIDNIYASFKSQIGAILTSLRKYQEGKVSALNNYVNGKQNLYREADWAEIVDIVNTYSQSIRESKSRKDADNLYNSAIRHIDSVLTIEEHNAEELKDAKYEAVSEVKRHYGSFDLDSMPCSAYSECQQK